MNWPSEAFLHLRQILTPKSRPAPGGNLLYVKSDNGLYLMDSDGTEHAVDSSSTVAAALAAHESDTTTHGTAGNIVGTSDAQVLTNKDLTSATNSFPSALATDAEVTSAVSTHAALTATHGATGAVVGTTNTQTLTNKTLSTGTKVGAATTDISGAWTSYTPSWTGATTNPVVNNGTLSGKYVEIGKTCIFEIALTMGTTTTYGSGQWRITLPSTPASSGAALSFAATLYDASSGVVFGRALWKSAGYLEIWAPPTTAGAYHRAVLSNVPFIWTTSDQLVITGSYERA